MILIYNVKEFTPDDGPTRKQHYIHTNFQQQFNITTTITKAMRIGQHQEKPRLLKITVCTESERPQFYEVVLSYAILQTHLTYEGYIHYA